MPQQTGLLFGRSATTVPATPSIKATGASGFDYATVVYRESLSIDLIPTGVRIGFLGAPGQSYNIERASAVTGPWSTNATLTAASNGVIEYIDTIQPTGSAFYRTSTP